VHLAQADEARQQWAAGRRGGDGRLAQRVLEAEPRVGAITCAPVQRRRLRRVGQQPRTVHRGGAPCARTRRDVRARAAELERAAPIGATTTAAPPSPCSRPTLVVAAEGHGWLTRFLPDRPVPVTDDEPRRVPRVDDLAAASDLGPSSAPRRPANVAPDGWVDGEPARALAGRPRVRLPERGGDPRAGWRWRWGMASTPPALLPYPCTPGGRHDRLGGRVDADILEREALHRTTPHRRPLATITPAAAKAGGGSPGGAAGGRG